MHYVALLDDLDKELNNYVMRSKEWYGWHFPELAKIITDNTTYIRTVLAMGMSHFVLKDNTISFELLFRNAYECFKN